LSTRTALTIVGGVVGAYFGYPQLGLVIGGLIGGAVDPQQIQGPKIGELSVQTSQEGAPRTIVYGTIACYGNIIQAGPVVKVETSESQGKGGGPEVTSERALQTFAIRICEGPIAAVLRVWQDNKLVYDMRTGSGMIAESQKWMANKLFYLGGEDQLPDPTLTTINPDTPSYRGTAWFLANSEDITDRRSISQYRFEVAKNSSAAMGSIIEWADNDNVYTYADLDPDENPILLSNQEAPESGYRIIVGNGWDVITYSKSTVDTPIDSSHYTNLGDSLYPSIDQRFGLKAVNWNGYAIADCGSSQGCRLIRNGSVQAHLCNSLGQTIWPSDETASGTPPQFGNIIWFSDAQQSVYIATMNSGLSTLHKHSIHAAVAVALPLAEVNGVFALGNGFWMHKSRQDKIRVIDTTSLGTINVYDEDLIFQGSEVASPSGWTGSSDTYGFGVDEALGLQVFVYKTPSITSMRVEVCTLTGTILSTQDFPGALGSKIGTRVLFSNEGIWIQRHDTLFFLEAGTFSGNPVPLSEIVSDIHERCGASNYDVSELIDEVAGLGLAGDYTGASAIDVLRPVYFFDKSEHDKKLWYPKRGAAVIETLTVDDLTEVPDTTSREQAIEVPKKLHLRYQHANSGYAPVKATASASSPDMLTTGEAALEVPIVLNEDQAAQTVDKMYKVTRSEIRGTTEITVPLNIGAKYVAGNCIGLSLRGRLTRERIEEQEFQGLTVKLTLKPDRQSAYTSDLTGVPIPPPTLPPSTIVGETILAVMDIPGRIDTEDLLGITIGVDGALPPWYGARYQRSLDGGASYSTVADITVASVMGVLLDDVPDASQHVTDTTNSVRVQLYRDGHTLDSISQSQFMTEGGAFALEKSDGSWEILQARDWEEDSTGAFEGTTLHRGLLDSGTSHHAAGQRFVMLQRPQFFAMQSAWLNTDVTHRAISLGENADDTTNETTQTYVGRSQIEWSVTHLELDRDVSDVITATWAPRHRFGTDVAPVASVNFQGYRVTLDDGVLPSVTFDTLTPSFTYDASALGDPLTVTVQPINRITGAGPSTSESV
jgi:hypothetical protein